jgi:tetratricopeptide (TPR) repeat protein
MTTKLLTLSIIGVLLSFIGGFLLANSLNRNEINGLRADNERMKKNQSGVPQNQTDETLSEEELRLKIAEADKSPNNFSYQRNLGLALYRYGAMRQDPNLIAEAARLLQRAYDNNPKDYDVTVALGNSFYDIGFFKKELSGFVKAREFYRTALEQKPNDADVRVDLGLSYYLAEPPELDKAAAELEKALEANPKQERALQFMTQTMIRQNKMAEAEKYLARLREINPQTPALDEVAARMTQENKGGE